MKKGKFFKRSIACALAVVTLLSLTSCATLTSFSETFITKPEADNNTVKIGVYEPMSGSEKSEAAREIAGIELAYTIYPTVDGKKVELVYQDNRSQLEAADAAMKELISKEPLVMLGSYGDTNSLAASAYLDEAKLPAIAITNTNPLITAATDYYFRVCIISPYQGDALAYYTYKALKEEKACVLVESGDEESATIAQRFILKMQELTGDDNCIAVNTEYTPREMDYTSQLEMIRDSGAKAVLLPGSENDAATIISQANEMNLDVTFMGIDSWNPEHIADNVDADSTARAVFTRVSDAEATNLAGKRYQDFMTVYENKYGEGAVVDNSIALGFDAYTLALDAIKKAGSDSGGQAVMQALKETQEFYGATGKMTFNAKGDPRKLVNVYSIEMGSGAVMPIYTIDVDGKVKEIN